MSYYLRNTSVPELSWADLLALVCDVYRDFVTFPFSILRWVCYLIVSIPDPCCLSYLAWNGLFLDIFVNGKSFAIITYGVHHQLT